MHINFFLLFSLFYLLVLGFYRIIVCGALCVSVWTSLSEIKVMYVCMYNIIEDSEEGR